jgi:hypothetical protein
MEFTGGCVCGGTSFGCAAAFASLRRGKQDRLYTERPGSTTAATVLLFPAEKIEGGME